MNMLTLNNTFNDTIGEVGSNYLTQNLNDNWTDNNETDGLLNTNEKDNYVFVNMFEYITEGVLLTSISVLGVLGNILAMYVLHQPSLKGTFSNALTGLASFDALFLATLPFTFGLPILSPYYEVRYFPWP